MAPTADSRGIFYSLFLIFPVRMLVVIDLINICFYSSCRLIHGPNLHRTKSSPFGDMSDYKAPTIKQCVMRPSK
jgi:hypothetical protein